MEEEERNAPPAHSQSAPPERQSGEKKQEVAAPSPAANPAAGHRPPPAAAKPARAASGPAEKVRKPEPGKPPVTHGKEAGEKLPPGPERNPVERWLDAYLGATAGDVQPKKFKGSMRVTEAIPQIRLVLECRQPPLLGSRWRALAGLVLGLVGGAVVWNGLEPSIPGAVGLALFATVCGFSVYRLLRPAVARVRMDSMVNRLQWETGHGAREITFVGCDSIRLQERRVAGGFRYRVVVEPRWGRTIPIATTAAAGRTEALLNAVELVRGMVQIMHLPVRVRVSRLAVKAAWEPPPVPQAKAAVATEEGE